MTIPIVTSSFQNMNALCHKLDGVFIMITRLILFICHDRIFHIRSDKNESGQHFFSSHSQIIEKESAVAESQQQIVAEDEAVANQQAGESQALKDECEAELAEAIPALEAAISALNTLKVFFPCYTFVP